MNQLKPYSAGNIDHPDALQVNISMTPLRQRLHAIAWHLRLMRLPVILIVALILGRFSDLTVNSLAGNIVTVLILVTVLSVIWAITRERNRLKECLAGEPPDRYGRVELLRDLSGIDVAPTHTSYSIEPVVFRSSRVPVRFLEMFSLVACMFLAAYLYLRLRVDVLSTVAAVIAIGALFSALAYVLPIYYRVSPKRLEVIHYALFASDERKKRQFDLSTSRLRYDTKQMKLSIYLAADSGEPDQQPVPSYTMDCRDLWCPSDFFRSIAVASNSDRDTPQPPEEVL